MQHPLLHSFGLTLTVKRRLLDFQVRTRAQLFELIVSQLLYCVFDMRILALRRGAAHPAFLSASLDSSPAPEEGCGYANLCLSVDVAGAVGDEAAAAWALQPEATEVGAGAGSAATPLPGWHAVGWGRGAGPVPWQVGVAAVVREAVRLATHGVLPGEFALASA